MSHSPGEEMRVYQAVLNILELVWLRLFTFNLISHTL